ncbi:MAG: M1 family metallopeptidase [Planctomycetota bacterium]|nr:M1 family metallopeptidase [Planctomycetota bacterium]
MNLAVGFLTLMTISTATTASAQEAERDLTERPNQARLEKTIFSPLDLPTPNSRRLASGAPGPDYWQQTVDYEIKASLDPETRIVHGEAHITYTNASPHDLEYIWMNLEQNAFREDSIAAAVGAATAIGMSETEGDGYTISEIKSGNKALDFQVYDTLGRITLVKPIKANGGKFEFDITWDFTIPKNVFRRFGIRDFKKGKVYEIAQWIPAVAVYDDVHGWNTMPYIGTGEFYSNFGTYDVELTVPSEMIVAATGELTNAKEVLTSDQYAAWKKAKKSEETVMIMDRDDVGKEGSRPTGKDTLTWKFHAEDVRTFAWACSDAFIYDAASTSDGTFVQTFYPAEGLPVWGDATQMARVAIEGYNQRLIPYPYPTASNVLGAEGGMEYPMIIFCRGRSESSVYGVTTHEIGHNWFPMVINTDERRHAWMDEGFNTFINGYSTADWFGEQGLSENDPARFAMFMTDPKQMPVATPPDMLGSMELGVLEYMKTGVGLTLLRETILGPERFDYAFRKYMERWAFKSPQPADFFRTMEDASGMDLAWFWRGWFYENAYLDWEVSGVAKPKPGVGPRVRLDNLGKLVMPVHLRVTYTDGSSEDYTRPVEIWFQANRVVIELPGNLEIAKVTIDPDKRYPDIDRKNNIWDVEKRRAEKAKSQ